MHKKTVVPVLMLAAAIITFSLTEAKSGGFPAPPGLPGLPAPPNMNVRINGYLPAPPGVNVQIDSGRPYYVERDRRVYMKKRKHDRHYKKEKKHYEDNGNDHGHGGRGH